jgi:hypothetical protein
MTVMDDQKNSIPTNRGMNMGAGQTEDQMAEDQKADQKNPHNLTPREAELLAEVLAAHPSLTPEEALAELRAAGM